MSALDDLLQRPAWHQRAACRGISIDLFFPQPGQQARIYAAVAICRGCPVIEECGEAGLSERHGVWGGLSEKKRRVVRRIGQVAS